MSSDHGMDGGARGNDAEGSWGKAVDMAIEILQEMKERRLWAGRECEVRLRGD